MPGVYSFLRIDDDPTGWKVTQPIAPADLTSSSTPIRLTIAEPRTGALLLSSRAVASVVLATALSGVGGATPNGGNILAQPFMYLPSVTGLTSKAPSYMYALPIGSGLAALEEVATAMAAGDTCTVDLADGAVVLNGATLRFAVFFDARPVA
jgi:hypothetical protein